MKNLIVTLGCLVFALTACDNKKSEENQSLVEQTENVAENTGQASKESAALWDNIEDKPANFDTEFKQFNDVQKYYFCAAFSVGALSDYKPETASAMVNYFLGLGVAKYGQGIDDGTYSAFDFGKHIFSYKLVVKDILDNKICENIMLDAAQFAKDKNLSVEYLNNLGKPEVEKIIKKIK